MAAQRFFMRVKISPAKNVVVFYPQQKNAKRECVVQQEVVLHEDLPWIERVKEVNNSLNLSNSLRQGKKVAERRR
jgi:hypothetical protein